MSRKRLDMQAEAELGIFLDKYFYSRLVDRGELTTAQRISDIEIQRKGIDVIALKNDFQAFIDEKAQLYYINQNLPTFAFELSFLLDGSEMLGWFLNDELCTDRYFLLWPNATTSDLAKIKARDFTVVYGLMIKKSNVRQYLERIDINKDYLLKTSQQLRKDGKVGRHHTEHKGINFFVSDPKKYSERPINLVISKEILRKIASAEYRISPDTLKKIPRDDMSSYM